jgi:hypothetical protein
MVRGLGIAVTAVAGRYQCADTDRIAFGRGSAAPSAAQPEVHAFFCRAFIGLPWPKNTAGMRASDTRLTDRFHPPCASMLNLLR